MSDDERIPLETALPEELLSWLDFYDRAVASSFEFERSQLGRWQSIEQANEASERTAWYAKQFSEVQKHIIMRMNAWTSSDPEGQLEIGSSSSHSIPTDEERAEVHRYLREKYAPDAAIPGPDEGEN